MKLRRGFTLIELLVSIAIMGLLIALLVPNISRSLQKNQIAEDVELFKAKLEETRLMAGSTQQTDVGNNASTYYGLYIAPISASNKEFYIVRVNKDLNDQNVACTVTKITKQIFEPNNYGEECIVERVGITSVITNNQQDNARIVAFKVPTQQLVAIKVDSSSNWAEFSPIFSLPPVSWDPFAVIKSSNSSKEARVKLGDYSGKVTVEYKTIQ